MERFSKWSPATYLTSSLSATGEPRSNFLPIFAEIALTVPRVKMQHSLCAPGSHTRVRPQRVGRGESLVAKSLRSVLGPRVRHRT